MASRDTFHVIGAGRAGSQAALIIARPVDRDGFSLRVTQALEASPNIWICRKEVMAVTARNRQVRRERQCAAALDALAALVGVVPGHAAALSL